jgi:small-conductance mechanosensitive channel
MPKLDAPAPSLKLWLDVLSWFRQPMNQRSDVLIAAAQATPHIAKEPHPFVLQTSLNDFNVSYQLNAYT